MAEFETLHNSKTKKEEIKFFLEEYQQFENENYDFYYIISYEWLKSWDSYMTDSMYMFTLILWWSSTENKLDLNITNIHLINEDRIIKQNLIENVDYAIIPKNVAFYFHDEYKGDRRLKTKNRHLYHQCDKKESNP